MARWVRVALAESSVAWMVPPLSLRLLARTDTPSESRSRGSTVWLNGCTTALLPSPEYMAKLFTPPMSNRTRGVPPVVSTVTASLKVTLTVMVSPVA